MKKIILLLLAVSAVTISCNKNKHVPVSYSVETEKGDKPQDVYLPDSGSKYVELYVKFLTGSPTDSVTLEIQGLPLGVTVTPQRSSGIPTYYYKYVYHTTNATVGTYPVSILATAPGTDAKTYNYNLIVIPSDCATLFIDNTFSATNDCSTRGYTYQVTAKATGNKNVITLNNLGGYGTITNTTVNINCQHDSVYIYPQDIGNGITLQGNGTFTDNKMVLYYTATGSTSETCTATLTKQ
ncbi:MAG: hypothetical protein JWQ38_2291 [Flavipsychrobacter sp.]|nr:hypothetical protein [Flavipsychrobacter sp.]